MSSVRRHYRDVELQTQCSHGLNLAAVRKPIVVVPVIC